MKKLGTNSYAPGGRKPQNIFMDNTFKDRLGLKMRLLTYLMGTDDDTQFQGMSVTYILDKAFDDRLQATWKPKTGDLILHTSGKITNITMTAESPHGEKHFLLGAYSRDYIEGSIQKTGIFHYTFCESGHPAHIPLGSEVSPDEAALCMKQSEFKYIPYPHEAEMSVSAARQTRRIQDLEGAMQTFVDRCERGEVRSKKTYAQFKDLLANKLPGVLEVKSIGSSLEFAQEFGLQEDQKKADLAHHVINAALSISALAGDNEGIKEKAGNIIDVVRRYTHKAAAGFMARGSSETSNAIVGLGTAVAQPDGTWSVVYRDANGHVNCKLEGTEQEMALLQPSKLVMFKRTNGSDVANIYSQPIGHSHVKK